MKIKSLLCAFILWFLPNISMAQEPFTVFLNDVPHSIDARTMPCYPVMARFYHPNPNVTRIRMRYPYNHAMYMHLSVYDTTHIALHENFMKKNQISLSDFIAEDDNGNSYGKVTLTFVPMGPENKPEACNAYVNS